MTERLPLRAPNPVPVICLVHGHWSPNTSSTAQPFFPLSPKLRLSSLSPLLLAHIPQDLFCISLSFLSSILLLFLSALIHRGRALEGKDLSCHQEESPEANVLDCSSQGASRGLRLRIEPWEDPQGKRGLQHPPHPRGPHFLAAPPGSWIPTSFLQRLFLASHVTWVGLKNPTSDPDL